MLIAQRPEGKALAGLWDRWQSADESEIKESCTIIVTAANKFAGQFHDRMPVILG